jgi:uncharacterized lipoprotein YmbA
MIRLRLTALVLVVALAAGCSILAPVPDPSRFYTLAALPDEGQGALVAAGSGTITYGLGPISLPLYLGRNEVATRVSPNQITYSDVDRWADPLEGNVKRVLLQNLSGLLGTARIQTFPWSLSPGVDYQIEIAFLRFDRDATGDTHLVARWIVRDARSGADVVTRESRYSRNTDPSDTAASIAALSSQLGDLSQEIAGVLRALPAAAKAP